MKTLYDRLQIKPTASTAQIRAAYYQLALKHHPDKVGDTITFRAIQRAYQILGNASTRRTYDKKLKQKTAQQQRKIKSSTKHNRCACLSKYFDHSVWRLIILGSLMSSLIHSATALGDYSARAQELSRLANSWDQEAQQMTSIQRINSSQEKYVYEELEKLRQAQ